MIKDRNEMKDGPMEIDLSGPQGNAFVLMGITRMLGKQIGLKKEEVDEIIEEMQSSDYDSLVDTMDKYFGEYIILYR